MSRPVRHFPSRQFPPRHQTRYQRESSKTTAVNTEVRLPEKVHIQLNVPTPEVGPRFVTDFPFEDSSLYSGPLINGVPEGVGKQVWPDGSFYHGDFAGGKRHGRGEGEFVDYGSFNGEWNENHINYGFCRYPADSEYDSYKGYFGNWRPDGRGILVHRNGRIYEGDFVRGLPDGEGKLSHRDESYIGQFHLGKRHGWGVQETKEVRYEGYWQNDKENGFGTMYYLFDQTSYTGYWKNGAYNGIGIREYTARVQEGKWTQGRLTADFRYPQAV